MTTQQIFDLAVKMGIKADLRGPEKVKKYLERSKQKYEKMSAAEKKEFDLEKLWYQYYKLHLTLFNSIPEEVKRLQNYLRQHKNVVYEDQMLGGYDLEFELQFKNNRELREFIDKLRQKFSSLLKDYEILHYYKEYKLKFF